MHDLDRDELIGVQHVVPHKTMCLEHRIGVFLQPVQFLNEWKQQVQSNHGRVDFFGKPLCASSIDLA